MEQIELTFLALNLDDWKHLEIILPHRKIMYDMFCKAVCQTVNIPAGVVLLRGFFSTYIINNNYKCLYFTIVGHSLSVCLLDINMTDENIIFFWSTNFLKKTLVHLHDYNSD